MVVRERLFGLKKIEWLLDDALIIHEIVGIVGK